MNLDKLKGLNANKGPSIDLKRILGEALKAQVYQMRREQEVERKEKKRKTNILLGLCDEGRRYNMTRNNQGLNGGANTDGKGSHNDVLSAMRNGLFNAYTGQGLKNGILNG